MPAEIRYEGVLQPHLGEFNRNYKPENTMGGYLTLAKVINVHHKNGTVDLEIIRTGDIIKSDRTNEGRFGAVVGTSSAHYNKKLGISSGTSEPLQKGQLVVVGFLDGMKDQPVVLCSFHDVWETNRNINTNNYPLQPKSYVKDFKEASKWLKVFPSQAYMKVDGMGGIEMSHPAGTFIKADADPYNLMDDRHGGFNYENLSEKNAKGTTLKGTSHATLVPPKFLFTHTTHKGAYESNTHSWTKWFVDTDGLLRISRDDNDGKLTYLQMDSKGSVNLRRQINSNKVNDGNLYSELKMKDDCSFFFTQDRSGTPIAEYTPTVTSTSESNEPLPRINPNTDDPVNTGKRTNLMVDKDGNTTLLIVQDTKHISINMTNKGELKITSKRGDQTSTFTIDEANSISMNHYTGSYIKLDSSGDIIIEAKNKIRMNQGG